MSKASSEWNRRNREKCREAAKRWREANRDEISAKRKEQNEQRNAYNAQWRADNRDHVNEQAREYYDSDPQKFQERSHNYRQAHLEGCRAKDARYRVEHREERNAAAREYHQQHKAEIQRKKIIRQLTDPSHYRRLNRSRYARRCAEKWNCRIGDLNKIAAFYEYVLSADNIPCHYCGQPCGVKCCVSSEVDHQQPLSRGGDHDLTNMVACCRPCNVRKGSKTEAEFREYLALVERIQSEISLTNPEICDTMPDSIGVVDVKGTPIPKNAQQIAHGCNPEASWSSR